MLVSAAYSALQDFDSLLLFCKEALADVSKYQYDSLSSQQFTAAADNVVRDVLLACQHTVALLDQEPQQHVDSEDLHLLVDGHLTGTLKLVDNSLAKISLQSVIASCIY